MNQVIIVTGPAGAGKSSVAAAICERFDRMMHIEVDTLRQWVRAGFRHGWLDDPMAREQRVLAVRNAAAIARNAIEMRYAAVIDGIVFGADADRYRDTLTGIECNVHFVTLLPNLDVALRRDGGGAAGDQIPDRVTALYTGFAAEIAAASLPGAVIDSTDDASAELTADRVLDAVARGDALFMPAAQRSPG